jgi:hypothetical protein
MQALNSRDLWRPSHPNDARSWLSHVDQTWWIAGGWALDLFLGAVGRSHGDSDIDIFRDDAPAVVANLYEWEIFETKDGVLDRVFGEARVDATYSQIYGKVLPSNTNRETTIEVVRILGVDQAKAFYAAQKRIETTICFCSVYGDCWVAHRQTPKVQTVDRCETSGVMQFEPQM